MTAAIIAYIDDQRQTSRRRKKAAAAPPLEYALIVLAKEYGQDPLSWPYDHDGIAVRRLLNILSVAGQEQSYHDRIGPDSIRLGD